MSSRRSVSHSRRLSNRAAGTLLISAAVGLPGARGQDQAEGTQTFVNLAKQFEAADGTRLVLPITAGKPSPTPGGPLSAWLAAIATQEDGTVLRTEKLAVVAKPARISDKARSSAGLYDVADALVDGRDEPGLARIAGGTPLLMSSWPARVRQVLANDYPSLLDTTSLSKGQFVPPADPVATLEAATGRTPTPEQLQRYRDQWRRLNARAKARAKLDWQPSVAVGVYIQIDIRTASAVPIFQPVVAAWPQPMYGRMGAWAAGGDGFLDAAPISLKAAQELYRKKIEEATETVLREEDQNGQ